MVQGCLSIPSAGSHFLCSKNKHRRSLVGTELQPHMVTRLNPKIQKNTKKKKTIFIKHNKAMNLAGDQVVK